MQHSCLGVMLHSCSLMVSFHKCGSNEIHNFFRPQYAFFSFVQGSIASDGYKNPTYPSRTFKRARQPNNSTKIYIWRKLHKPLQPKWTLNSMNWCGRPDMHWRRAKLASRFISHWRFRGRIVAREEKCVQLRKQETLLAIPIQGTAFLYGLRVIVVQTQPQQ